MEERLLKELATFGLIICGLTLFELAVLVATIGCYLGLGASISET